MVRIRDEHLGRGHVPDAGEVQQVGCHGAHNVLQLLVVRCQLGMELQDGGGGALRLGAGAPGGQVVVAVGPSVADLEDLLVGEGVAGIDAQIHGP